MFRTDLAMADGAELDRWLAESRTEVPEPSTEDGTPRDFQAYELTVDMLEDLLVAAGVAASEHGVAIRKTAGALVYKIGQGLAPEPQGEPSDAQVQAALDAYFDPEKPNWRGELAGRMRAALRAAAEAGGAR